MRLYLDDDCASPLLARLLRQARHDIQLPRDVGKSGVADPLHLAHCITEGRVFLTGNHRDFEDLHTLLTVAQGHHPGILVIRKDNDPKRDLTERGVVRAIAKLLTAGVQLNDQIHVLNRWR